MTEEQQFKTKALSAGMDNLNAEYRNRMDRETDSYHQAIFQLLLNVDETWRAKNEKSWFETALDNIAGHEVATPLERWKPEINEWYWKLRDTGVPLELKWTGTKQDWDYYHYGNCFRTNAEAVAARDMVKKALLG
jgi:hypothetical protein